MKPAAGSFPNQILHPYPLQPRDLTITTRKSYKEPTKLEEVGQCPTVKLFRSTRIFHLASRNRFHPHPTKITDHLPHRSFRCKYCNTESFKGIKCQGHTKVLSPIHKPNQPEAAWMCPEPHPKNSSLANHSWGKRKILMLNII